MQWEHSTPRDLCMWARKQMFSSLIVNWLHRDTKTNLGSAKITNMSRFECNIFIPWFSKATWEVLWQVQIHQQGIYGASCLPPANWMGCLHRCRNFINASFIMHPSRNRILIKSLIILYSNIIYKFVYLQYLHAVAAYQH
jgi:hypothetical protein